MKAVESLISAFRKGIHHAELANKSQIGTSCNPHRECQGLAAHSSSVDKTSSAFTSPVSTIFFQILHTVPIAIFKF